MGTDQLETHRLRLQPLPSPAAAALPGDRDEAARLIGAQPSADWPQAGLLGILPRQAAAPPDAVKFGVWLIIERETNEIVGDLGFLGPPGEDRTVEIGYAIVPDRRRRGYITEAARALIDWVHNQPGVDTVIARCEPDNDPSIRTLERLGFTRDGELGGWLRWRR